MTSSGAVSSLRAIDSVLETKKALVLVVVRAIAKVDVHVLHQFPLTPSRPLS